MLVCMDQYVWIFNELQCSAHHQALVDQIFLFFSTYICNPKVWNVVSVPILPTVIFKSSLFVFPPII